MSGSYPVHEVDQPGFNTGDIIWSYLLILRVPRAKEVIGQHNTTPGDKGFDLPGVGLWPFKMACIAALISFDKGIFLFMLLEVEQGCGYVLHRVAPGQILEV